MCEVSLIMMTSEATQTPTTAHHSEEHLALIKALLPTSYITVSCSETTPECFLIILMFPVYCIGGLCGRVTRDGEITVYCKWILLFFLLDSGSRGGWRPLCCKMSLIAYIFCESHKRGQEVFCPDTSVRKRKASDV